MLSQWSPTVVTDRDDVDLATRQLANDAIPELAFVLGDEPVIVDLPKLVVTDVRVAQKSHPRFCCVDFFPRIQIDRNLTVVGSLNDLHAFIVINVLLYYFV